MTRSRHPAIILAAIAAVAITLAGCANYSSSSEEDPMPLPSEAKAIPDRITMIPDDYNTEFVGTAEDGRHFFLTTPFEPGDAAGAGGNEFVALFYWNSNGEFDSMEVDEFGSRESMDSAAHDAKMQERLKELGEYRLEQISVAPFSQDAFDSTFGLVPRAPEDPDGIAYVELLPGNYVAYTWPWDGEYDT